MVDIHYAEIINNNSPRYSSLLLFETNFVARSQTENASAYE